MLRHLVPSFYISEFIPSMFLCFFLHSYMIFSLYIFWSSCMYFEILVSPERSWSSPDFLCALLLRLFPLCLKRSKIIFYSCFPPVLSIFLGSPFLMSLPLTCMFSRTWLSMRFFNFLFHFILFYYIAFDPYESLYSFMFASVILCIPIFGFLRFLLYSV